MVEPSSDLLAELRNVSYTHWNHQEPTLQDVSLTLRKGTLNVLVGPGGSGKSTLCDLFNGKIPHLLGGELTGDVFVDGLNTRDVEVKDLAQKVGHVFQDPESMFATLYVEDEIAFGPENLRHPVDEIRQRTEELLDLTQLLPKRKNLVWNLSGGQVQKLGLATALAMTPKLIVLDEPTSNLDPAATKSVHDLVLTLRDKGMTVLLVTRELDEFLASADQLLVLANGRMVAAGEPREVLRSCGDLLTELGIWLPETAEIGLALHKANLLPPGAMPITVGETLDALRGSGVVDAGIKAVGKELQSAPQGETLVSAKDLRFTYGGGVNTLKDVSLDIHAGEMVAIVGRNGAGKSTLARLLVGLLKPQSGDLTLFGRPARQWRIPDLATNIALVFQNPEHQFLTDRVEDEIAYSLTARGVKDPEEIHRQTHDILQRLDLMGTLQTHPFALSAGMKRRLGVATMLVGNPKILLVDEPTYGQDRQMTQTLMALMEDIRSHGVAVVMITHDMRLVQEYAERVVVMCEGCILYEGSPHRLFEMEDTLTAANLRPTLLQELLQALRASGTPVEGDVQTTADFLAALPVLQSRLEDL